MTEEIKDWTIVSFCPVCQSADTVEFITNVPPKIDRPTTSWRLCQGCSHLFVSPRPTDEWLDAYYKKGYRQDTHGEEASDKVPASSAREEIGRAMRIVSILDGFRGNGPFRRHLDIGSSTGALLATAMDKFKIPQSVGVEPNEAWRTFATTSFEKYLERKKVEDEGPRDMAFYTGLGEAPGVFDLITISHVIEHIPDLDTEMDLISEKLSADGVLYIEAPFAFGGVSDPMMFPHIHVFTPNSLGLLVENHGMRVHRLFLEGSSAPFWPPHQHLIVVATKTAPSFQKADIMERYIHGRDAVRRAMEQMKQGRPTYDLG